MHFEKRVIEMFPLSYFVYVVDCVGFTVTTLLRRVWSKSPSSDLPCLSVIVDIDNHFVRVEKTLISYANHKRIRIFYEFLFPEKLYDSSLKMK